MNNDRIEQILENGRICRENMVCPGPQGPTGPTGPIGPGNTNVVAYGGIYNSAVQLVFFTAVNDYLQVKLTNPLPSLNITPNNSTLTISETGDYEITYNILVSTSQAVDIGVAVRNNGTVIPVTRGTQTLSLDSATNISYDGRLSAITIVSLTSGDILDLAVQVINNLPTGLDAIINNNANATLTVRKLN